MSAILFTKQGCKDCEWIKANCDLTGASIQELDGENAEALALLAYYSCVVMAEKKLPILVVEDEEIVSDFAMIRERLNGPAGTPVPTEDCGDACKL